MPRNLVNCGGCSACAQIADFSYKYARTGSAISHYADYAETVDIAHNLGILPSIVIWGALPERMYTIAAGLARLGTPVVVGPSSGLDWNRFMLGNKWDWRHWWTLATLSGKKRATEPAPRHMMVPVETKEEAVAMLTILCTRPPGIREARQATLEHYTEMFTKFFGELPDDWHLYVRADGELPMKTKGRLLKELKEKHGWEVERLAIKKVKHPDGRILDMAEFKEEYSAMGTHITHLPRLVTRSAKKG
jgi:acetyl-CoA decarbonylase/synthase complex subunit alpha